ncbi:MAG TPA: hypothetical protein VGG56_08030 [Terracidiphilus sp.]|jgi:hypothetical protein
MSLCRTNKLGPDKRARVKFILLPLRTMLVLLAGLLAALPAIAQYPGQVTKDDKDTPELRSIAVLEWTGDEKNPKASRLVPVAVFDQGQLQDGGIYLARPEPLAVAPEVEYELELDGKPTGLFDITNAGQQMGSWVGFGSWKPMPAPRRKPTVAELARTHFDDDDAQSDEPVLHRKHHADDAPASGSGGNAGSGSDNEQGPPSDPDRPVLHKKSSNTDSAGNGSGTNAGSGTNSGSGTSNTSGTSNETGTASAQTGDPDRPVLHKSKKSQTADTGSVESVADDTDPDRPRLKRGKSSGDAIEVAPSLVGLPPELHQVVAVSDAKSRPPHPWDYAWANADDEAKLKASLEDMARNALGLNPPAAPAKPVNKRVSTRKSSKPAAAPPPPATLEGEQFHVFELAYGSGATLVLSAHTDGPAAQQKFVTLLAQPDLYGNVLVLLKNVTDDAHLDEKPRMHLVGAVDALADNRGELLFELRGATQRQFALYRVLRGRAEQLFVTGGGQFGAAGNE